MTLQEQLNQSLSYERLRIIDTHSGRGCVQPSQGGHQSYKLLLHLICATHKRLGARDNVTSRGVTASTLNTEMKSPLPKDTPLQKGPN